MWGSSPARVGSELVTWYWHESGCPAVRCQSPACSPDKFSVPRNRSWLGNTGFTSLIVLWRLLPKGERDPRLEEGEHVSCSRVVCSSVDYVPADLAFLLLSQPVWCLHTVGPLRVVLVLSCYRERKVRSVLMNSISLACQSRQYARGRLDSYLVDPASSHMLVSKIKPCMSKYILLHSETANGSLNQLWFLRSYNPTWITVVILELIHATPLRYGLRAGEERFY